MGANQYAFLVFQLAQVLAWSPGALYNLDAAGWGKLLEEIESFGNLDRRRVLHDAFERRFREHARGPGGHAWSRPPRVANPRFQVICCIDEREESFQRHVEEVAPDAEAFSVAGFFSVAMYYRGAADAHYIPHAPSSSGRSITSWKTCRTRWKKCTAGVRWCGALGTVSHRFTSAAEPSPAGR